MSNIPNPLYDIKKIESVNLGKGIFDLRASSPIDTTSQRKFKAVNTVDYLQQIKASPIIQWGKSNKYPDELLQNARKCSVLLTALDIYCRHLYGQGFFLYEEKFINGQRQIVETDDNDIRAFVERIKYEKYYHTACFNKPFWGQVVPIFVPDSNRGLAQIRIYNTRFCRLEMPNPDSAISENIYVSAQWWRGLDRLIADGTISKDYEKWVTKIPLLNDYDPAEQMKADTTSKQWAMWLKDDITGDDYGSCPWHACHENGWIGIAVGVPKMMERLFTAAMTLNYTIGIDVEYWKVKFKDWEDDTKWDDDSRVKAVKEFQDSIDTNLGGSDKSYKSFIYQLLRGNDGNQQLPSIKIDPVNNKIREGDNYIPNAQQANAEIVGAVGLDPSMIGYVSGGGKQSAGSGSPIREALNALTARMLPDRRLIHQAFEVARDYQWPNGEKSHIKIGTRDIMLNSLDGSRPPASTITNQNN